MTSSAFLWCIFHLSKMGTLVFVFVQLWELWAKYISWTCELQQGRPAWSSCVICLHPWRLIPTFPGLTGAPGLSAPMLFPHGSCWARNKHWKPPWVMGCSVLQRSCGIPGKSSSPACGLPFPSNGEFLCKSVGGRLTSAKYWWMAVLFGYLYKIVFIVFEGYQEKRIFI